MLSSARLLRMLVPPRRPLGCALLALAVGCSHRDSLASEVLAQRILPPPDYSAQAAPDVPPRAPEAPGEGTKPGQAEKTAEATAPAAAAAPQPLARDGVPCQPLAQPDALALAFQLQPRLRASLGH
jgi:hypothetical protein